MKTAKRLEHILGTFLTEDLQTLKCCKNRRTKFEQNLNMIRPFFINFWPNFYFEAKALMVLSLGEISVQRANKPISF